MKAPRRPARSLLTPSFIEQLEARQLLAVTFADGVLTVNGGNNADNIRVNAAGNSVVVHLNRGSKTFTRSAVKQLIINGNGGNDRINVTGAFDNTTIDGGAGNDTIKGSGGGDLITGGAGNDVINGRGGDDQLYGDAGNDKLNGGAGNDTLGGDANDMLSTTDNPTTSPGNDTLNGGAGNDWLLGGTESDIHNDPNGSDVMTGGPGVDITDIRGRDNTTNHFETGAGDTITDTTDTSNIIPVHDVTGPIPNGEADYTHHKHAFLKITINGQLMLIPSRVGEFLAQPVVHTHDNPTPLDVRGYLLHFHNTASSGGTARVFTLGDFFEHWGISFSSKNIGRFRVDSKHTLTMQVKPHGQGSFVTPAAGDNFNNYVIQTNDADADDSTKYDQIIITYAHI